VREGATVVSTSTRNFPDRLGKNSKVFLASAELAAMAPNSVQPSVTNKCFETRFFRAVLPQGQRQHGGRRLRVVEPLESPEALLGGRLAAGAAANHDCGSFAVTSMYYQRVKFFTSVKAAFGIARDF
jgi:hypothetical protein